jgi:hypothetical protein
VLSAARVVAPSAGGGGLGYPDVGPSDGYAARMTAFDGLLFLVLTWGALALAAWAFIDALVRPAAGFVAAGKLTKPGWAAITALAIVVIYFFGVMSFFGLPAVIASIVYLVDVRPAVRGLRRGNSW